MTRASVLLLVNLLATLFWLSSSVVAGETGLAQQVGCGATLVGDELGRRWFEVGGERILSLGVNTVTPVAWSPREGTEYYDALHDAFDLDRAAWERSVESILTRAGFNTLACWSDRRFESGRLLTTPILYVADHRADRFLAGLEPDFEDRVRQRTLAVFDEMARPDRVLGVFLDNEVAWWGRTGWDRIPNYTALEAALERSPTDAARKRAMQFLQNRFGEPESMGRAFGRSLDGWSDVSVEYLQECLGPEATLMRAAFTALVAEVYFGRACAVVRELAPNALILGVRFAGDAPDSVIEACGRHCDVVSLNLYRHDERTLRDAVERMWLLGRKPLLITEFSFRAHENLSGNPNDRGAGTVVESQADRAHGYTAFTRTLASFPTVVGWHWFEWADQSPQGRFDGENSNYGVVSIRHEPYETLLEAMRVSNEAAPSLHAKSTVALPAGRREQRRVHYHPGQHPDRAAMLSLLEAPVAPIETWNAADAAIRLSKHDGALLIDYESGYAYGVGISMRGPTGTALGHGPANTCDLDGYERIVLDAEIPLGLQTQVIVNEAGAADPNSAEFDVSAGDDAEAFISAPRRGRGARETYRFRIDDLIPQVYWGNQLGGREIQMWAVQSIALQFQGEPRRGVIRIHDVRLER